MCDKDYYCKGVEFIQKEAKCFSCPSPKDTVTHVDVTEPDVTPPSVYIKGNLPLHTVRCVTKINSSLTGTKYFITSLSFQVVIYIM